MKKRLIYMASAALLSTTLFLTSCAEGENGDMPPESTTGDTQETGVEGTGDLPGTGIMDTTQTETDTTNMNPDSEQ